ncbi:protein of unknown function (plasmid) [Cupriavidus taiwanensis]|uniref:Uncharacterized protein n=1 Tax=Cupriavidus taiwanensis TaxID=164546 RepID=A0A375IMY8_9BURK|nr:protein of unknown function [Cupriavidus taiwanensis]
MDYHRPIVTWGGSQTAPDGGLDVRVALPSDSVIDEFVPLIHAKMVSQALSHCPCSQRGCRAGRVLWIEDEADDGADWRGGWLNPKGISGSRKDLIPPKDHSPS